MGLNPEPDHRSRDAAHEGSEVIELLEVLWEQGREAVPTGPVSPSQLRVLYTLDRDEGINLRMLAEALGSASPRSADCATGSRPRDSWSGPPARSAGASWSSG